MLHNDPTVNDVCLSLINNSSLHTNHCAMARNGSRIIVWNNYLHDTGLPTWRREHGGTAHVTVGQRMQMAAVMQAYYEQYITEG